MKIYKLTKFRHTYGKQNLAFLSILCLIISACNNSVVRDPITFDYPDQGKVISIGDDIKIKLHIPTSSKIESINYFIDGKFVKTEINDTPVLINTKK